MLILCLYQGVSIKVIIETPWFISSYFQFKFYRNFLLSWKTFLWFNSKGSRFDFKDWAALVSKPLFSLHYTTMICSLRFLPIKACMDCPSLRVDSTWTKYTGAHCTYLPEQGITDRVGTLVFAVQKYQFYQGTCK